MQSAGMEYLESRLMFGMVPGLESTRALCDALGNPEKKFRSIHVVGTNGKGSTSYYLAGVLQAHGLKTGLYVSPHLVSLRERIRIDDVPIPAEDLDRLLLKVKAAADSVSAGRVAAGASPVEPTFFEVLTLVAFLYYAEQKIDVAVLEAGMGGRLDSTAVAGGEIAVVTSIGLEHTEVLGPTESAILREKMGVLGVPGEGRGDTREVARGKTFIVGGISGALLEEAREYAAALGCKCVVPEIRGDIVLPNLGRHYVENASLSLAAAAQFISDSAQAINGAQFIDGAINYDDALALKTLATRSWAGRMQLLAGPDGRTRVILDGAHNSHAVRRLVEALRTYYPGKKFHCLFGALKDKDVGEMLKLMAPHVACWHITKTPYPRFRELADLRGEMQALGLPVASEGELSREYLDEVRAASDADKQNEAPLLITGSLYMIGASIQLLRDEFTELAFFRGLEPTTNEHR
ncbi:folylpolyglutamate synthase/dihydrofolate synthase family protein [Fibrobacter sp. UWT3]|uniref:bifunctional folylpolyglutamate synthase/dihydrofolate synthase n=1 Tax=Fibrobacter sp. UWT3 TaxID=1896225 RepID=UPI000BE40BF2|nr:cyanophycin synthetase [Fibrobacter sp. UWT3]